VKKAFTLLELLTVMVVVGILAALSVSVVIKGRAIGDRASCVNSLRQLGMATQLYLTDHGHVMFPYKAAAPGGTLWYFGFESFASSGEAEGDRVVDVTQSRLYPYLELVGKIEVCPAFPYNSALWKAKYKGASYGYGYNTFLSNRNIFTIAQPAEVLVFGDCAQVNTFQPPASPTKPMIEEFYLIDNTFQTIHFRHEGLAQFVFLDGHVEALPLYPGTLDSRLPAENIGRITPVGSMQYLQ
jgi:prepilin-type N-terminal cleavage/methylation domain-containing protein/prepilin-type processing-associated H-X9-DG protein